MMVLAVLGCMSVVNERECSPKAETKDLKSFQCGFDSRHSYLGSIVQWIEQRSSKPPMWVRLPLELLVYIIYSNCHTQENSYVLYKIFYVKFNNITTDS